jgi:ABC-type Fe3+ transport system substrate-binding protein
VNERVKSIAVKRILFGFFAGVLSIALAGCGGGSSDNGSSAVNTPSSSGAATANKLVIISPHPDSIKKEFENAFNKQHPGVTFQWLSPGGSSDLLRFVLDQYKTKSNKDEGIGADVFFGGGMESFMELEDNGLLQQLPSDYHVPAQLNGVPLRGNKNTWIGAALSGFGILYNKQIATRDKLPVPHTWGDLGNPKLYDRIELADPRKSGSAHVAYEIILQTNGWEKGWQILAETAGNARSFIDSSSQLVNDVSNGEAVFVPTIDFYARAKVAAAGANKIGYIAPQGQSVTTPDPIGVLRGAKNQQLAQQFVAFVLSPAGQKLWMLPKGAPGGPQQESLFRAPVLPALYQPMPRGSLIESNPFAVKNARPYDAKKAAARRQVLDDLIGAVLIDNQDALRAKMKSGGAMPILAPSENDVAQAAAQWSDPSFSQQQLSAWRDAAAHKLSG